MFIARPLAPLVVLTIALPLDADAFAEGPPDGFAGNPPNNATCTSCHNSFPLNSGDGSVSITGLPSAFVPFQTYDLSVVLEDPGQIRWGFELTAQRDQNDRAGFLAVSDPVFTQLSVDPGAGPDYLKHTLEGTRPGLVDGPVTFSFQWTAPDEPVATFYVAGNAANASFDPSGDYIYTHSVRVLRMDPVPVEAESWSRIKNRYR